MKLKYTQYFLFTRKRPDRVIIKDEWLKMTINQPLRTEVQSDGRIRKWAKIGDKYLRVILLEDGITIHNAFFDRNFKEK